MAAVSGLGRVLTITGRGLVRNRLFLTGVGLAMGYAVFVLVFGGTPQVAVMDGPIGPIDRESTPPILAKLQFVADNPRIKAVVIRMDSGGGAASDSEALFTSVLRLRQEKPVVVTVAGVAASGAYYMAVGANRTIANGTSIVGSVGAILVLPERAPRSERVISTGPFKLTGGSERSYLSLLEQVKDAFYLTVESQRGDRLRLSRDELLEGKIYLGLQALQLGLIDGLGSEVDAVRQAAALAGLRRYEVISVEQAMLDAGGVYAAAVAQAEEASKRGDVRLENLELKFPYIYYLFLPP